MSRSASGAPIIAPPPNPMMAMPVAIPRRSGNHLMSVETGEMYPSPNPMPPMMPEPSQSSHAWWNLTPIADITSPPHQHIADATPAARGPARSTQRPQMAAAEPRKTKNSVYIQPSVEIFQSQVVVKICAASPESLRQGTASVIPMAFESG